MFRLSDTAKTAPVEFAGKIYQLRYPSACPLRVSLLAEECRNDKSRNVQDTNAAIQSMLDAMFLGEAIQSADLSGDQLSELMDHFRSLESDE
jgi:hypothetical protein